MAKLALTDITSAINTDSSEAAINANNALLETALENTLSRDGTSPNTMSASLDMNSNFITNLPAPTANSHAATKAYVDSVASSGVAGEDGTNGTDGDDGWSPIFAVVSDGTRRVLQLVDWTGGAGTEPATGTYVGPVGMVALAADAVDIRGATGLAGAGTGDLLATNNLSDLDSISTARTNLGLVIGTDVQAYDADLAAIAALAKTDGNVIVGDGAAWVAESGATARTSLGLGTIATQAASSVAITGGSVTGITDLAVADGGTGSSTAANARTALGLAIGTDVLAYDAQIFSNIPQQSKSAAYTLVLTDGQKHIFHPSADTTARIWTIPANASVAFPVGTAITFVNQDSAGVITIAITTDTMRLAGDGTVGSRTLAANGIATALKVTTTEWIISGTGLT